MMKSLIAGLVAALVLSGCAPATLVYGESRKVSKGLIAPIMAAERPGAANEAATICVLKGMTVGEVLSLPNSKMAEQPEALRGFVLQVAARPGVGDCLAAAEKGAG